MGTMIDGKWHTDTWIRDNSGHFKREATKFHSWITADATSAYPAEANRYHLYICLACPWAHRTLITRALKGLDDIISVSIVDPFMGDDGWFFGDDPDATPDDVNHTKFLREIYLLSDSNYSGRVTVPILWDKQTRTIVNNESRDIMRMLSKEFDKFAKHDVDLAPTSQLKCIEQALDDIYMPINNGVYRAGFATTQTAYEESVRQLFDAFSTYDNATGRANSAIYNGPIYINPFRFDQNTHQYFEEGL